MIERTTAITDKKARASAIKRFKERKILLPTFKQMRNPELIPENVLAKLKNTGLWDLDPVNLFRITWKNEPIEKGGLFGGVNYIELPSELTGVDARIIMMVGKWFPTGAHKVGAAYGCLAPRIVTGGFDPTTQKAVWPSTGNYCRGGAFDSYLMGTTAVAILPEEMSKERFEWLKKIGAEVIATPGCESNVKEIYDKCWEIRKERKDAVIFNQFDEFGNGAWHYNVTGSAIEELYNDLKTPSSTLAAFISNTGSAGTIAAGDYLKTKFPSMKTTASEALQCSTLYNNGFGGHRIEGIGDKHVPWIHNVKSTDVVTAIDDTACMNLLRLFNEKQGHQYLKYFIDSRIVHDLQLLGISSIANLISAVKTAKYFELTKDDIIMTVATDSADMYQSRIKELRDEHGDYCDIDAAKDYERYLRGTSIDYLKELSFVDKKQIHNLKYYTWIEQQQKEVEDLNQLWSSRTIWNEVFTQPEIWDELIEAFNDETGVLKEL